MSLNSFTDEPKLSQFILKNPTCKRANPQFIYKKLRQEWNTYPNTTKAYETTRRPTNGQQYRKQFNEKPIKLKRKRKFPSYTKVRKQREEFRKKLVSLILIEDDKEVDDNTFPNMKERQLLRYYYYIKHGIDTEHIAPLNDRILQRILNLIPKKLSKWQAIIASNVTALKSEYLFESKRAVVDYFLGESLEETYKKPEEFSKEHAELKHARSVFLKRFIENRTLIKRHLFVVNQCLKQILDLWQTKYTELHFVAIKHLSEHNGAFDLNEFMTLVYKQINATKEILCTNWYDTIKSILQAGIRRNIIPDANKLKLRQRFFNCVNILMTQCLQDIAIRSLKVFTEFMTEIGKSNLAIRLHVLLEDEDKLTFIPSFMKMQDILQIIDNIMNAVQGFERIERRFHQIFGWESCVQIGDYLKPIIPQDIVDECRLKINEMLDEQRIGPELRLQDFDDYLSLINGSDADKMYKFMSEDQAFEDYCDLINHYGDIENEISTNVWGVITLGLYEFHRTPLINTMEVLAKFIQTELLTKMIADQQLDMALLQTQYEDISDKALTVPLNTAELMKSKAYVAKMESEVIAEMEEHLKTNLNHFLWLMDHTIYSPLEIKQNSMTFRWYLKMPKIFEQNRKIIEEKTNEYQEYLRKRIEQFRRDLDLYWEQLADYDNWGNITFIAKYKKKATILDNRLTTALEKIGRTNEEEESFGWKKSEYPLRQQTHDKLLPYKKLFDAGQDFIEKRNLWLNSQVGSFDPIDIANDISVIQEAIVKLEPKFEDSPSTKKLMDDIKSIIDEFKLNMPIIQTLGNPGLKLRHWEQISEMVGFPIKVSTDLTLQKIIDFGLEDYLARFEKISESATKENSLEVAMDNMIVEWRGIQFIIIEYRDTGTYILSSVNDIQTLLDDHIIKTQAMKNSPYIKPFQTEILNWESKLVLLQDIVDDWLRVQSTWIYLEPIFSSPDIQQQMPEESRRFSAVDKIWKDLMKQVQADPAVMSVVEIDKMSEKLRKAFNLLEIIQKGLNTYLETKRLYFPRFFFLSNDGLLEILAETRDPKQVQPHLRKCFAGIHSLTFNEMLEILSIKSVMGEEIKLTEIVSTSKARGQVEKWLLELEIIVRKSVCEKVSVAFQEYSNVPSNQWSLKWPAQCVHVITRIKITAEIESNILNKNLPQLLVKYNDNINDFIKILEQNLQPDQQLALRTLIIFYSYAVLVIRKLMEKNAESEYDFDWISQMRFYYSDEIILVKMVISTLSYGFEYIGNVDHLVITPLTDRCYRIIFVALNSQLGAAIQGESCIGKTEMIKDLAKDTGKECILFNCSDSLDYLAVGKFLKGVAACGTWFSFDEFDRISIDTLSVTAQQIFTIQRALCAKQESFIFNGITLQLNTNCAIFIITKADYSVNYEIPENLKSLFRPVALTVPDLSLITEIELHSYGFLKAKLLALKITTIFHLCSQQLSLQHHYDFRTPLRCVKSILRQAAALEKKLPQLDEETVILSLIKRNILCKLSHLDANMFQRILNDIFPDTHVSEANDSGFKEIVIKVCNSNKIDCPEYFLQKIQQIYEMILHRSGIMLIGDSFSGKTTAYRMLAEIINLLANSNGEQRTSISVINPQSLTLSEFYGEYEKITHDWRDGILANNFRSYCNSNELNRRWLVFDGPVDSVWMENMNSVLDDNKKLCLMSGEILYLTPEMNLLFEISDLQKATPSIVSRCGVVFMQSSSLGWQSLVNSWANTLPSVIQETHKQEITTLFMRFCPILLYFIRNGEAVELLDTSNSNLIKSLLNIFDCFLDDFNNEKYMEHSSELDIRAQLEGIFFFSCIWSLGAPLNQLSRERFSELFHGLSNKDFPPELYEKYQIPQHIRALQLQKPFIFTIPKKGVVFDYRFIKEGKGKWKLWSDEIASAPPLSRDIPANQIIITTVETIRVYALLDLLTRNGKSILLVGPTATGKTFYATDYFTRKIDGSKFTSLCMNFSPYITADQTQNIIMAILSKRRKGVFGPPLGKKCVLFIDDLSMPLHTISNAQPPIELIRLMMDHMMWYEKKDYLPVKLIDIQVNCAIGAPYLTGKTVTSRFLSHFNVISVDEFSNDTLKMIFSKIVLWHLDARGFSKEFDPCIDEIVQGTLKIHHSARQVLLPTPEKCHYIFNVRDFSRVIQGVLLSVPEATEGIDAMRRLWVHEVLRVYGDRLTDDTDKQWLFENICQVTENELHSNPKELFSRLLEPDKELNQNDFRKLIFCDFTNPKADTRNYLEVQDIEELRYVVESYLVEFNNMSKRPMNLVLFRYAIEHLSHVCRVLKQPRSHAIIIGLGGIGRQSYTRLAAHITDNDLFQIEMTDQFGVNEWRDFVKAMLIKISLTEAHGLFLFTDFQTKGEHIFEDINNLLKSGEILDLFNADEKKDVIEKIYQIDKQRDKSLQTDGSPAALYNFFVNVIREQLHIVLCLSPDSINLRSHIRKYPSLINCCSVIWLHAWPEDALLEVSNRFLSDESVIEENRKIVIDMLLEFQSSAKRLCLDYWQSFKKQIFIPPVAFVESIYLFKERFKNKQGDLQFRKKRYQKSLERLDELALQISSFEKLLESLEPQLREVSDKVSHRATNVQSASEMTEEQREHVKQDEAVTSEHSLVAADLSETCFNIMSVALPMMLDAENALSLLTPSDVSAIRTMKNPSIHVKIVMEAICILKDIKTDKMSATTDEYWSASKKLLADPKFLESLINYDKDAIGLHIIKRLEERVLTNEAFDEEKIKSFSLTCECFYKWILALIEYDKAIKLVTPKRIALKEAEEVRDASVSILNTKIEALRLLEENLADLQRQLSLEKQKLENLKNDNENASKKLQRATEMVTCLTNENERWTREIENIDVTMKTLLGDTLIAAGIIAYLGEFTHEFRMKQISEWLCKCELLQLFCDSNYSFVKVSSDPIQLKQWHIYGLPDDLFLIDGAAILTQSKRWPLIIDSQGYANKWIKMIEKSNRLCIIKLTQPDYLRVLENALQYGLPVLLENVTNGMDPILESILLREVFKQSGSMSIKLGDSMVEYNDAFRLYITTNLSQPDYSAEIAAKVTIVNFVITDKGLENSLLATAVMRERPDLEAEKNQLTLQSTDAKKSLRDENEKILSALASDESILENDNATQLVTGSKMLINELNEKQSVIEVTEKQINAYRAAYAPIASHASILYFTIADLVKINPMYQYSLSWFIQYFTAAIDNTDKVDDIQQRLRDLIKYLTNNIYRKISAGLFEKDKFLFSIQLAKNIYSSKHALNKQEWLFLINKECSNVLNGTCQSPIDWLSNDCWRWILCLGTLLPFTNLSAHILENQDIWRKSQQNFQIPEPWCTELSSLQKLLIIKCFHPLKLVSIMNLFIVETLGKEFSDSFDLDLSVSYADTTSCIPILFILSQTTDPISRIVNFSYTQLTKNKCLNMQCFSRAHGRLALKQVEECIRTGDWIILQNCHLAPASMKMLERIIDNLAPDTTHPDFRLWVTSKPTVEFPISILRNSVKVIDEEPKDFCKIMNRLHNNEKNFCDSKLSAKHKQSFYSLCYFHDIIRGRQDYGSIGWNEPYRFTEFDLQMSVKYLLSILNEYEDAIVDLLQFIVAECIYGGHIFDRLDKLCLETILKYILFPLQHEEGKSAEYFSDADYCRHSASLAEFMSHMSTVTMSSVYELHTNAELFKEKRETTELIENILIIENQKDPVVDGIITFSDANNKLIIDTIQDIYNNLPTVFKTDAVIQKFEANFEDEENMLPFLMHEMLRYNNLLNTIKNSLATIEASISGKISLSVETENDAKAILLGQIPETWQRISYLSLKPLGSYIRDLNQRLKFIQAWYENGPPKIFWLPGFYVVEVFFTQILRNYAHTSSVAYDLLEFDFHVVTAENEHITETSTPKYEYYINGLFIEGARWCAKKQHLIESMESGFYDKMPTIKLVPVEKAGKIDIHAYNCPLYYTLKRSKLESTNENKTNFITCIGMDAGPETAIDHWILRGCALFCQLAS